MGVTLTYVSVDPTEFIHIYTIVMSIAASRLGEAALWRNFLLLTTLLTAEKVGLCPKQLPVTPKWGHGVITHTNTASTLVTRFATPVPTPACPGMRCVGASAGVRETIRCVAPT